MFPFEYLNKQKMLGGFPEFEYKVGQFVESLTAGFHYSVEMRNPNYLNRKYFDFYLTYVKQNSSIVTRLIIEQVS